MSNAISVTMVWVEEFGGGDWVEYPLRPVVIVPAPKLSAPREVLQSVLYGPGYQGPVPTRSTTGVWTRYPGL